MKSLQRIYSVSKVWGLFLCLACDTAQNGITSLIRVIPEPPGENCPNGGSLIEAGQDINADGQLAPAEVTATTFVCNGEGEEPLGPVLEGSFTIENEDDIAKFQNVEEITGNLRISAQGIDSVSLPNLTTIDGDLNIFDIPSIDLPSLTTVHGDLAISDVPSVDFPELTLVGVGLSLGSVVAVNISKLVSVGTESAEDNGSDLSINIFNNENVSILADNLTLIDGALSVSGLGALGSGGGFTFSNSLQTISGDFQFSRIRSVSSISFPDIQSLRAISIDNNDSLVELDFPSLTSVTAVLDIRNNPLLPDCQVQSLLGQFVTPPASVTDSGNNGVGTCP